MLTRERAKDWLDRWDRQQEYYVADREERFAVIADVVELGCGRPDPLIVDLGVGPGSLAARLLDRLPEASVVGVDADPLLLGLARAAYGHRAGLTLVRHDLRRAGWIDALNLDRAPDAFVSTTALHWLTPTQLNALYRDCGRLLRPGGLLIDGDELSEPAGRPRLDAIARGVGARRAERAGVGANEDWEGWWHAVEAAPELADLLAERSGGFDHHVDEPARLDTHLAALAAAGFAEAGVVWQHGRDRVVVGVR